MKQNKPMRGIYWTLGLALCVLMLGKAVYAIVTEGFVSAMNSNDGWGLIVPALYFAAYLIVPRLKFLQPVQTGPAVPAEENAPLAVPARLTVIRDSSALGAINVIGVFLDGAPVCQLKNGESAVVTLTMKHSVLMTNAYGSPDVRCDVTAPEGGSGELHMKSGAFLPKTLKWN